MTEIALIPGSFDPITAGHTDIIRRAAKIFSEVIVVVAQNKDKSYLFTPEQRLELVNCAIADIPNAKAVFYSGIVADYARKIGGGVLVKGIRNGADAEYENHIAEVNKRLAPEIETVYIPSEKGYEGISSTAVRELIKSGESGEALTGSAVWEKIKEITKNKQANII